MVMPFKKGPDYIDAAWLSLAAGCAAGNLDLYFMQPDGLRALFARAVHAAAMEAAEVQGKVTGKVTGKVIAEDVAKGAAKNAPSHALGHAFGSECARRGGPPDTARTLSLIEGNRGLFDGLDDGGSCSTAELARVLECPVLLSLNCSKLTRTAAALVRGVTSFEPGLRFCGVVLSQVGSARHENALRRALEQYTDVPVLGALPRLSPNPLPERHMGIACASEGLADDAEKILEMLADFTAAHLNLDAVDEAAMLAPAMPVPEVFAPEIFAPEVFAPDLGTPGTFDLPAPAIAAPAVRRLRPRIGYVRDAALWFYYNENLEALRRAGAELVRLSLLDATPWPAVDGVYLGGGFPEDHAAALAASPHLAVLSAAAHANMPIYAECGGFMVLAQAIARGDELFPMSGVFPVTTRFCAKPQGLGYVAGRVLCENPYFPVGMDLRGHEFHYSRCVWAEMAPNITPNVIPNVIPNAALAATQAVAFSVTPNFALALSRGTGMGRCKSMDGCNAASVPLGCNDPAKASPAQNGVAGDGLVYKRVWASYMHIFAPAAPCWAVNFVRAARD